MDVWEKVSAKSQTDNKETGMEAANAQDEADQLRAVERERLRSLVEADVETAKQLHADDFQLINPLGGALSKDEYLGSVASGDID